MGRAGRVLALVLAIVIVSSGVILVASRLSAPPVVTIATYRQTASLPAWVAEELGFFTARRVDARIVEFSGGGLAAHVLATGGADIASMPTVLALQATETGSPLRLVHATGDVGPGGSQILIRSDLAVDTLEDLRGRVLSFDALEASCLPCGAFARALENAGVSVAPVAVPDYKIAEAFAAKLIDAAVASQPFNGLAVRDGLAYPLLDPRLGPAGDAAALAYGVPTEDGENAWLGPSGFWTLEGFLESNPETVHRVSLALADAMAWLRDPANAGPARQILTKYAGGLGAPEFFEAATAAVLSTAQWRPYPHGYSDWQALEHQVDVYLSFGLLDHEVDVRPLVLTPWFRA